jgi:hypothetical protein
MDKPLTLSIGGQTTHRDTPAAMQENPPELARTSEPAGVSEAGPADSLAEMCEILKRHEETLRDLIVEVRLLYHNLPAKEQKRLEENRARTTREVGESFAAQVGSLEEKISRLRG